MCCGDKHGNHGGQMHHGMPFAGHGPCGCAGRMFLSKREKIEMLENHREALKNELEGVEEALRELAKE